VDPALTLCEGLLFSLLVVGGLKGSSFFLAGTVAARVAPGNAAGTAVRAEAAARRFVCVPMSEDCLFTLQRNQNEWVGHQAHNTITGITEAAGRRMIQSTKYEHEHAGNQVPFGRKRHLSNRISLVVPTSNL